MLCRRKLSNLLFILLCLSMLAIPYQPVLAQGTSVSNIRPINLIAFFGDLYWTQEFRGNANINRFGSAAIYRTAKNATSGNETLVYYEEQQADGSYKPTFAGLVVVELETRYGYFIAKYSHCTSSCPTFIKRVPLGGGNATIIATIPYPASYMHADGSYLYWADDYAVRRMPINGGTITKLANKAGYMTKSTLSDKYFYYVDAGTMIKRVPIEGGPETTLVSATSYISDFYIQPTRPTVSIIWGEENGAVRSKGMNGEMFTYQKGTSTRRVSSVGFDGMRLLWIDCVGYTSCRVMKWQEYNTTTLVSNAGDQAGKLIWDLTQLFWGRQGGIQKYVH